MYGWLCVAMGKTAVLSYVLHVHLKQLLQHIIFKLGRKASKIMPLKGWKGFCHYFSSLNIETNLFMGNWLDFKALSVIHYNFIFTENFLYSIDSLKNTNILYSYIVENNFESE